MSERSSFVTEYIHCPECAAAVKAAFLVPPRDKWLCANVIKIAPDNEMPIVAGKIGGGYPGEELLDMQTFFKEHICEKLCHTVHVAMLLDSGTKVFMAFNKDGMVEQGPLELDST